MITIELVRITRASSTYIGKAIAELRLPNGVRTALAVGDRVPGLGHSLYVAVREIANTYVVLEYLPLGGGGPMHARALHIGDTLTILNGTEDPQDPEIDTQELI